MNYPDQKAAAMRERIIEVGDDVRDAAIRHEGFTGPVPDRAAMVDLAAAAIRLVVDLCDPAQWSGCQHEWRPSWPHLRPLERCEGCGAFRSPDLPGEVF